VISSSHNNKSLSSKQRKITQNQMNGREEDKAGDKEI
jgi:hypothetical protein